MGDNPNMKYVVYGVSLLITAVVVLLINKGQAVKPPDQKKASPVVRASSPKTVPWKTAKKAAPNKAKKRKSK